MTRQDSSVTVACAVRDVVPVAGAALAVVVVIGAALIYVVNRLRPW